MTYENFNPFYERIIKSIRGGYISKILFSILLGAIVLGIHYLSVGNLVFEKNGWLLSIIITVASLGLFYATYTFRMLLPKLGHRIESKEREEFVFTINNYLSDRGLIAGGIIFGFLNCLMGGLFGLPNIYNSIPDVAVILSLYFIVGFICGLAVSRISGVTKYITSFSTISEFIFDHTSQDKCGVTRFIGWSLLIFSIVTLIVGMLITGYISTTVWTNRNTALVESIYFSWILFPYVASIFVLLVPAISINRSLTKYKFYEEKKLSELIKSLSDEIESEGVTPERKSELYTDYKFHTSMRKDLHEMRTWPFSTGTNSTYFVSLVSSFYTTYASLVSWLSLPSSA